MMKKLKLLAFIVVTSTSIAVSAQTAILHSASGVQISKGNTALASAYTAAQGGDTLYLSGGTFTPPAAFDKKLMIFGAGHYVDSTLATGKTFINGNVIVSENADLFYLEGIEINGNFSFSSNHSINNAVIKRCKINGTLSITGDLSNPSNNLSLIGNVFNSTLNLSNATNVFITNNIFNQVISPTNGNYISNNIFLSGGYSSSYGYCVFWGDNNQLNNNIFLYPNGLAGGIGNVFKNNLMVAPTPAYGTTPTVIDNYTGIAQTAIFVTQTGTAFNYDHNYHLQSPATYIGTDGSQIGIYGGTFPYKEGAVPLNPHITIKNIAPATDNNGNLQIQIQVGAQND